MKTVRQIALAMTVLAGIAAAPVSQAREAARADSLALNLAALAPAPVARMSGPQLAERIAPPAAAEPDWQAWAAARHAEITERVLRDTAAHILEGQPRDGE
jgi:hypothetical protein